jgi:hypothetical protein
MFENQPEELRNITPAEADALLQGYGRLPDFRVTLIPFNVNVGWLVTVC